MCSIIFQWSERILRIITIHTIMGITIDNTVKEIIIILIVIMEELIILI